MKKLMTSILITAGIGIASQASALNVPLSEYNLVVENDFTYQGGSIWGTSLIGGDINGNDWGEYASRVTPVQASESLTVLGDINRSVRVLNGGVVLGGNIASGKNVELNNNSNVTPVPVIRTATASDTTRFNNAISDLKDASAYYASLASNTSYTAGSGFVFDGSSDTAVFTGSASEIFHQNAQINFSNVNAETIIFNITGQNVNIGNTGWNFTNPDTAGINGLGASDVLWNFYEADTVSVEPSGFMGSILAMSADVTLRSTLDGAIGAKSLSSNRQIHDYYFTPPTGPVPSPVPIPGSLILFGSMLMVFGTFRRKLIKS